MIHRTSQLHRTWAFWVSITMKRTFKSSLHWLLAISSRVPIKKLSVASMLRLVFEFIYFLSSSILTSHAVSSRGEPNKPCTNVAIDGVPLGTHTLRSIVAPDSSPISTAACTCPSSLHVRSGRHPEHSFFADQLPPPAFPPLFRSSPTFLCLPPQSNSLSSSQPILWLEFPLSSSNIAEYNASVTNHNSLRISERAEPRCITSYALADFLKRWSSCFHICSSVIELAIFCSSGY